VVQEFPRKVAVWVNEADAMPQGDMLDDHIAQKRCFA
jgi:hypothetical protein